jgi:peptide deformylase
VRALDRKGDRLGFNARDFAAHIIQHEYDHIDGVLFVDRVRALETLSFVSITSRTAPAF